MPGETSLAHGHEIKLPGPWGRTVIFESNRLTYGGKTLYYKDITGIAFQARYVSRNFYPVSQSYRYRVRTDSDKVAFTFRTMFFFWNRSRKEAFSKLAGMSQQLIYPAIIEKLLVRIFQNGETIRIGYLYIDAGGYFIKKLLGGTIKVGWNEDIYIPKFFDGKVTVWRPKKGKGVRLARISMLETNAVLLPALIDACCSAARKHSRG